MNEGVDAVGGLAGGFWFPRNHLVFQFEVASNVRDAPLLVGENNRLGTKLLTDLRVDLEHRDVRVDLVNSVLHERATLVDLGNNRGTPAVVHFHNLSCPNLRGALY